MSIIRRLRAAFTQLLFPPDARCAGCGDLCGADDGWLCEACLSRLEFRPDIVRNTDWPIDGVWEAFTAYRYGSVIRGAIHTFKFRRVRALADRLAPPLHETYRSLVYQRPDLIVPIPLHRLRLRERGFNQSALLAERLSALCGVPCDPQLIRRAKRTRQQAMLPHHLRAANLEKAFQVIRPLNGQTVLLVDDIITSGSTANECASALRQAGAGEVWLIALANATGIHTSKKNSDLEDG